MNLLSLFKTPGTSTYIHPELNPGEVFLSNASSLEWDLLPWKSKRRGVVARDGLGNPLGMVDWFPVFISAQELRAKHARLKRVRREYRLEQMQLLGHV